MTISRHTITAFVDDAELDIITAQLTLDESWSPFAQGSIDVPFSGDTVDLLDPRLSPRVRINVAQEYGAPDTLAAWTALYGGGIIADITTDWTTKFLFEISTAYYYPYNSFGVRPGTSRTFDLSVRERAVDFTGSTVSVSLSSDEALLQDYALVASSAYASPITTVRELTNYVLGFIGAYLVPGTTNGTVDSEAAIWSPGQTAWDYLSPLIQACSLRLYCDEQRNWKLVEDDYTEPGQINLTATGNLTAASDIISRDSENWYDAVVITYTWVDGTGATTYSYDTASEPGFSKVLHLEYETASPALGAAQRILDRALGRGRVASLEAVSDYSAIPSQACRVIMPDTLAQEGFVSSVSWNYPDDTMQIKTRGIIEVPATAWLYAPVGRRWQDIAVGIDWTEYTP